GEATEAHHDPIRESQDGMRSGLSLALFLNDDFRGGALTFPEIGRVIEARAGRAVLFSQHLLHGDALVESGDRYLLEGEIFYAPSWRPYR
ncbi:MAG: 2OG-Fe(II) oxygenase, partial [Myxococcales bacterium]|nr:2OG-Fe(II) oxygenase [Myxococcales bacterium]